MSAPKPEPERVSAPHRVARELKFAAIAPTAAECLLICSEVGCTIIPASALARRFGDEAGPLHPRLACICNRVILMVAGLLLSLKSAEP